MPFFRTMKLNERSVAQFAISSAAADKEGYLNKKGELNRGYQKRWFVLKGNLLYYFERKNDKDPIGVVVLENCHVELAESDEPYAFQITFGGIGARTYVLGADTSQHMECWMKAITSAGYEFMKMMVQELEKSLDELTTTENELVNINNEASGEFGESDRFMGSTDSSKAEVKQTFISQIKESGLSFGIRGSTQTRADTFGKYDEYGPAVETLIDLDLSASDINDFGEAAFYSMSHKTSDELLPLSYTELEHLEEIHEGHTERRAISQDDSTLHGARLVPGLGRNARSKSERRKNNLRTSHELTLPGNYRPITRSFSDETGGLSEQGSVFRALHDLYGASIWVKVKECGKKDLLT